MTPIRLFILAVSLAAASAASWALPAEIEADRLLLLIKAARDAKDYPTEVQRMEDLAALVHIKSERRAKAMYEKYLMVAGKNGKYYGDALAALNRTIDTLGKMPQKDCDTCPDMQPIPTAKLAVSKYAVTFDEWDACVAEV